jgi:hypothetical protein
LGGAEQGVWVHDPTQVSVPLSVDSLEQETGSCPDRELETARGTIGGALDDHGVLDISFQRCLDREMEIHGLAGVGDRGPAPVHLDNGADESTIRVGQTRVGIGHQAAAGLGRLGAEKDQPGAECECKQKGAHST